MRLINADAFAEDVDKIPEGGYLSPHDLISLINARPTIEERKKGKWIDEHDMTCSVCGFECDDPYYLGDANYCPNCGIYNGGENEV